MLKSLLSQESYTTFKTNGANSLRSSHQKQDILDNMGRLCSNHYAICIEIFKYIEVKSLSAHHTIDIAASF